MRRVETLKLAQNERYSILAAAQSLKSDLPVMRVILFGSKARGASEPDSDIDLLVLTRCPVNSNLRAAISDRLADINLRNDVSLTSVVVSEQEWSNGLIRHMLIHREVERDGCEI
ncbi:MAG: nucleotidyltransferase domain-containing protein [Planctomycetota bacterium]|jgi:predicted nucleotidyltransferase